MSNPTRTRKSHSVPVIMYPEGVIVGSVRTGKNSSGRVRHVATTAEGQRVGTFDMYREAADHLLALARKTSPASEPGTPAQRSERLAGELVADVLAATPDHRYARAYGVLAGLIRGSISDSGAVGFAREVVRQLDAAQTRGEL